VEPAPRFFSLPMSARGRSARQRGLTRSIPLGAIDEYNRPNRARRWGAREHRWGLDMSSRSESEAGQTWRDRAQTAVPVRVGPWIQALALTAACSLLPSCSRPWAKYYEPRTRAVFERSDEATIRFEQVDYDKLSTSVDLPDYQLIGVSQFRDELQSVTPGIRGSSLREQAARVGAYYVRWAERPVGQVGRVSVYRGSGGGRVSTVADYMAVYYRRASD
jgi:hypothetical protein